jgi:hypothetical protein
MKDVLCQAVVGICGFVSELLMRWVAGWSGRGPAGSGDGDGEVSLQRGVSFGVIGGVSGPALPDDPGQAATEGP